MSHPTDTIIGPGGTHHGTAREWFVRSEAGAIEGPLSAGELRDRAATGRLDPSAPVSADRARWVLAGSLPWLGFPAATAPTAPQMRPLVETVAAGAPAGSGVPAGGASATFSPLDSVPGYELNGLLGTGACGVVFRAVQTRLNRVVALKTVRVAETAPADVLARFEQEAVSLARLQHPNIVTVYDSGVSHGRAFFAMELLGGEDLGQKLLRDGPLREREAWLIARQTAAALDHAAAAGVIHRDVKPANLFLVPPPTGFPLPSGVPMVKVTDFGLALTLRGADSPDVAQTSAGVFLGTPVYMAPEQFGGPVDRRADIYSLGATVYQALTGRLPFDGRTVPEVMRQKGGEPPRLPPPISEATADLVAAMMAPEARDRPENYAELIARIDALPCLDGAFTASGLPIATGAPAPALPPLNPAPLALEPEPLGLPAPEVAFELPPAPVKRPAPRAGRKWLFAVLALVLVGAGVGVAALAGAFRKPAAGPTRPANPVELVTVSQTGLFDGKGVLPWGGRNIELGKDAEKKPVLTGWGAMARPLNPPAHFRVVLALDPHEAPNVAVILATGEGASAATQWVVKLDRATATAVFGKRAGPDEPFEPLGAPVPVPTAAARAAEGLPPYLELKYERVGGALSASFNYKPLGSVPDAGLRVAEVRLVTDGPIKIESALLEELAPRE